MNFRAFLAAGALVGLLVSSAAAMEETDEHGMQKQQQQQTQSAPCPPAEEVIADWPEGPKQTATALIEKHGEPQGVTPDRLVWTEPPEPFHEIIVYRETVTHDFPQTHEDYLETAILYPVPADKFDDLAEFDGSVFAERTTGRLAARCHMMEANILALNLAKQIIEDEISVDEARQQYAEAVQQHQAGNTPDIMKELAFEPAPIEQARDPDQQAEPAA